MTKRLFTLMITLFLGSCFFFTSCNDDDDDHKPDVVTLYDLIYESDDHTILLTAIKEAGLEEVFKSPNLINTLFAPTDAAFEKLPEGTLDLLLDDPMNLLSPILLYHVINSKVTSADLTNGMIVEMADGQKAMISIQGAVVMINNATVTGADLEAENGVIHVINEVLLPPTNTVYEEIAETEMLSTLKVAIDAATLDEALSDEKGTFTLFAPTDDAFDGLPAGTVTSLLTQPDVLANILFYHALSKEVFSSQLTNSMVETMNGQDVTIKLENGNVYVNDAQVIIADIICTNGVVHIINKVLLPPTE